MADSGNASSGGQNTTVYNAPVSPPSRSIDQPRGFSGFGGAKNYPANQPGARDNYTPSEQTKAEYEARQAAMVGPGATEAAKNVSPGASEFLFINLGLAPSDTSERARQEYYKIARQYEGSVGPKKAPPVSAPARTEESGGGTSDYAPLEANVTVAPGVLADYPEGGPGYAPPPELAKEAPGSVTIKQAPDLSNLPPGQLRYVQNPETREWTVTLTPTRPMTQREVENEKFSQGLINFFGFPGSKAKIPFTNTDIPEYKFQAVSPSKVKDTLRGLAIVGRETAVGVRETYEATEYIVNPKNAPDIARVVGKPSNQADIILGSTAVGVASGAATLALPLKWVREPGARSTAEAAVLLAGSPAFDFIGGPKFPESVTTVRYLERGPVSFFGYPGKKVVVMKPGGYIPEGFSDLYRPEYPVKVVNPKTGEIRPGTTPEPLGKVVYGKGGKEPTNVDLIATVRNKRTVESKLVYRQGEAAQKTFENEIPVVKEKPKLLEGMGPKQGARGDMSLPKEQTVGYIKEGKLPGDVDVLAIKTELKGEIQKVKIKGTKPVGAGETEIEGITIGRPRKTYQSVKVYDVSQTETTVFGSERITGSNLGTKRIETGTRKFITEADMRSVEALGPEVKESVYFSEVKPRDVFEKPPVSRPVETGGGGVQVIIPKTDLEPPVRTRTASDVIFGEPGESGLAGLYGEMGTSVSGEEFRELLGRSKLKRPGGNEYATGEYESLVYPPETGSRGKALVFTGLLGGERNKFFEESSFKELGKEKQNERGKTGPRLSPLEGLKTDILTNTQVITDEITNTRTRTREDQITKQIERIGETERIETISPEIPTFRKRGSWDFPVASISPKKDLGLPSFSYGPSAKRLRRLRVRLSYGPLLTYGEKTRLELLKKTPGPVSSYVPSTRKTRRIFESNIFGNLGKSGFVSKGRIKIPGLGRRRKK